MKGTEGHSVIVSELVVKVYESHSVGPYTKETNLHSCAAAAAAHGKADSSPSYRALPNGIRMPSWGSHEGT